MDHIEVVRLDDPLEVPIDEVEARHRPPMSWRSRLDRSSGTSSSGLALRSFWATDSSLAARRYALMFRKSLGDRTDDTTLAREDEPQ
jgi:hypothetical protein